jgi:glycosyltransferase involved in cell wall biosynthesis
VLFAPVPHYAFTHQGSFSHVNRQLRAALDAEMRPVTSIALDVRDPRRLGAGTILNVPVRSIPRALIELAPIAVRAPRVALQSRFATTYMFDYRSSLARARAAALDPLFVLQTQTFFNSALRDRPFYIFTDHTALANRRYPVAPKHDVWSAGWIARERRAFTDATVVFTTSSFAKTSIEEDYGCAPDRIVVCGSGINVSLPPEPVRRDGPVNTVLFIGVEWERKGGPVLVEAFREVRRRRPGAQLVVVGCNPRIADDGVLVVGRVSVDQLDHWLRRADVFCMPSLQEPSAVSYLDAAAYSLPTIGTTVGGTPERIIDGQTGYLCPAGDPRAVADRLLLLMSAPDTAREMGQRGRDLVAAEFTWEHVAARVAAGIHATVSGTVGI